MPNRTKLLRWFCCLAFVGLIACAGGASHWEVLTDWITSNGGFADPRLELSTGPDPAATVRGVFATAPISKGKILAEIPHNVTISGTTQCGFVSSLRSELALGERSAFWSYLQLLEEYVVEIPNVWRPEELALLADLPLVAGNTDDWVRHLSWLRGVCRGNMSDPLLVRAALILVTRVNSCMFGSFCLSPLYDFFSHRGGPFLSVSVHERQGMMVLVANQDVERGQQLYVTYGSGTFETFRDYGFVEQPPQIWRLGHLRDHKLSFTIEDDAGTVSFHSEVDFVAFTEKASAQLSMLSIAGDEDPIPQLLNKFADETNSLQERAAVDSSIDVKAERARLQELASGYKSLLEDMSRSAKDAYFNSVSYRMGMPHLAVDAATARAKAQELRRAFTFAVRLARDAAIAKAAAAAAAAAELPYSDEL